MLTAQSPRTRAGSGHSFTPVVATTGLLLSLKNMQGLVSADLDRKRVVVRAGTRIGDIGRVLKQIGLSLPITGISIPRRSPAPFRRARMAPESGLSVCRPRRWACAWFSPTDQRKITPRRAHARSFSNR